MKHIYTLLVAAMAAVCGAWADDVIKVSTVTATGFEKPAYGAETNTNKQKLTLSEEDAKIYYFRSSWSLYKKVGDAWKSYSTFYFPRVDVYTEGEYYYEGVVILKNSTTHEFADKVTITIDSEEWTHAGGSAYSGGITIKSPTFTVTKTTIPLQFNISAYKTKSCYVGKPLAEIDLTKYVLGGGETYAFAVNSEGFDWLSISGDGKLTGTPTVAAVNSSTVTVEIACTSGSETVNSSFTLGPVYAATTPRTQVTELVLTGFIKPEEGADVPRKSILSATADAVYYQSTYNWQNYTQSSSGDGWWSYSNGVFYEGLYRYKATIEIDNVHAGTHQFAIAEEIAVIVDGETWTVDGVYSGEYYSYLYILSPQYTVVKETRTKVSEVSATGFVVPEYNASISSDAPIASLTCGQTYYSFSSTIGCYNWQKKDGENWVDVLHNEFSEGIYRYKCKVVIDSKTTDKWGEKYVLSAPLTVTIDGQSWTVDATTLYVSTDISYVNIISPEFTVVKPTPTALAITQALDLRTENGRVIYDGEFQIFDLLGRNVTRLNGSLNGVYIVKVGDKAQKIAVSSK